MTDAEREERSIWKLGEAGDGSELASMDNLAALVELADAIYAKHWTRLRITPSA